MVLKENEIIPHRDLISEMCPELMFVADCEAMLSKDSDIQNDDDDDIDFFDNVPDSNIHREKPPGKLSSHIPHAISVMSLNHKYEMVEYRPIWGTDVADRLIDLIFDMIANFQKNAIRYPNPILTAQEEFNFQNTTHCAYCNIEYSTIPNSMKHRQNDHHKAPKYGPGIRLASGKMSDPLIAGNYVNSSCALCNWKITNKRRTVKVF